MNRCAVIARLSVSCDICVSGVFCVTKVTNCPLGYPLERGENTNPSASYSCLLGLPRPLLEYLLKQFLKSHLISPRLISNTLPVRYSCCLHGPLCHSSSLGSVRGSNRKHFITVVRLAGLFVHLRGRGMQTCQLMLNSDSPRTCLLMKNGGAAQSFECRSKSF